jgi:methyl-accepting chemotaxis protein
MYVPEFRPTNQKMAISFLIIIIVLVAVWCIMSRTGDSTKTDNDISGSVAELENRIDSLESRVTSLSKRIDHAEKTLKGVSAGIEHSQSLASEIAGGIDSLQNRLDRAVQRGGRIQNILEDIERTNR